MQSPEECEEQQEVLLEASEGEQESRVSEVTGARRGPLWRIETSPRERWGAEPLDGGEQSDPI